MRKKSKNDRFPIVKHGYDTEVVESHLVTAIESNDRVLDEAAAQIAALQTELEESKKHEEAVHLTILAATQTKEDMLEVAQRQGDEARAAGRKKGDSIITDARMQAFQVVTEARKEADGIVAEARAEAAALLKTIAAATPPAASGPSEREIELQGRVEEMQDVIAAMETELRTRPPVSETVETDSATIEKPEEPPTEDPEIESPQDGEAVLPVDVEQTDEDAVEVESPEDSAESEIEQDIEIVVTDTAPIDPVDDSSVEEDPRTTDDTDTPIDETSITDDRGADAVRRSFYSRRSAKLPRIGVEAGRGAMAAAAGLRTGPTSNEENNGSDPDRSQEFETV